MRLLDYLTHTYLLLSSRFFSSFQSACTRILGLQCTTEVLTGNIASVLFSALFRFDFIGDGVFFEIRVDKMVNTPGLASYIWVCFVTMTKEKLVSLGYCVG